MAAIEVMLKYELRVEHVPFNKNEIVALLTDGFHKSFVKKWVGKFFPIL